MMSKKRNILIVLGVLSGMVACGSFTPREGWSPKNGPVVPHDSFPGDCSLCHKSGSWAEIREDFEFDHDETGYPLSGAHTDATCLMCHNDRGPVSQYAARGCAGCHEDTHRGRLGTSCTSCHDELTWRPTEAIELHSRTRFPLIGPHAAAECFTCHEGAQVGNFEGLDPGCAICHSDDITRATDPDHVTQGLTSDCQQCHVQVGWSPARFDHPGSFPLVGGHRSVDCSSCHITRAFGPIDPNCVSCHTEDYNNTNCPSHMLAGFSTDCMQCHDVFGWGSGMFEHTPSFPLTAGHDTPDCMLCHSDGVFVGTPSDCAACHLADYNSTISPPHANSGFSTDCMQCHDTNGWGTGMFEHPASFELTNSHAGHSCITCHTNGTLMGLSTDCLSCHQAEFNATSDPNHTMAGFGTDCMLCHDTIAWQNAEFMHTPSFPLTNGHNIPDCTDCHTNSVFVGTSPDCVSCHQTDYNNTSDPNHIQAGFSFDCMQCHDTNGWGSGMFEHTPSFPLTAGHDTPDCALCHSDGVFMGTPSDCIACHQVDYNNTMSPNHAASGISTDCMQCHDTSGWGNGMFQHPMSFALSNGHAGHACAACHTNGVLTGLNTDCMSCHQTDFNNTSDPNHAQAGFGTDCMLCHDTTDWNNANFVHTPAFPLTAGHNIQQCTDCHIGGNFLNTSPDCASCHLDDHSTTSSPNHAASGISTDCMQCHDTSNWGSGSFMHPMSFPLTNGHNIPQCTDCHTGGALTGLSTACASCHQTDYNNTSDPNHSQAGFSTDCMLCHDTTLWENGAFTHTPAFMLIGGHNGPACTECHVGGNFLNTSPDCVSCHLTNYNNTADPDHSLSGFGTDCMVCHDVLDWNNGVFIHNFEIVEGPHKVLDCIDCHTIPAATPAFSCIHCHEHRESKMADKHDEVGGYSWDSMACLLCHPDGRD